MNKFAAIGLAGLSIVVAVIAPIAAALYAANGEAIRYETDRAVGYARDVLHRSELTSDQIDRGFQQLTALGGDPCSPQSIDLMRRIDLASSNIKAIGHVVGDQMTCSSLVSPAGGLALGPVEFVQSTGVRIRTRTEFSFAPGEAMLTVERDGFAAIIHKDLPVDSTLEFKDVVLAVLSRDTRRLLTSRGEVKQEWVAAVPKGEVSTFIDQDHVVAVVTSQKYQILALSAVPIAHLNERIGDSARVLIPVGVAAAALLTFGILSLARQQTAMPAVLKSALSRQEFFLVYQPIVDLRTRRWIGAETLIRWRRANGEMIRPDIFIPVAEATGLITTITERVIGLVERDARSFFLRHPDFYLTVNLSPADLLSDATSRLLTSLAAESRAGPGNLMVEITERSLTDPKSVAPRLNKLRQQGVRVAIDDFGTGYSNLGLLEKIELDYLKIDKSFVDTLGSDAVTSHVVFHIIELAKSLHLETVAEGVETEQQAQFLQERGVHSAQGYLFAKPMPFADLIRHLDAHATDPQA